MITINMIDSCINEAERFIAKAKEARAELDVHRANMVGENKWTDAMFEEDWSGFGSPTTSACRRASMDVTRALAKLRGR
jgi:hypothetical protein